MSWGCGHSREGADTLPAGTAPPLTPSTDLPTTSVDGSQLHREQGLLLFPLSVQFSRTSQDLPWPPQLQTPSPLRDTHTAGGVMDPKHTICALNLPANRTPQCRRPAFCAGPRLPFQLGGLLLPTSSRLSEFPALAFPAEMPVALLLQGRPPPTPLCADTTCSAHLPKPSRGRGWSGSLGS